MKNYLKKLALGISSFAIVLIGLSFSLAPLSQECDKLIMQNGDEVMVKIVEITSSEIIYRPCNELDGINIRLPLSKAFMIKYANGGKQIFDKRSESTNKTSKEDEKPDEPSANTALIMGILGLIFLWPLSIVAWVIGNKSLKNIKNNPGYYSERSKHEAKIGKILGMIPLLLILGVLLVALIIAGLR